MSQTKAMPWAEGRGQFTTEGRGHGVFFVTNTFEGSIRAIGISNVQLNSDQMDAINNFAW